MMSIWLRELVHWESGVPLVALVEAHGRLVVGGCSASGVPSGSRARGSRPGSEPTTTGARPTSSSIRVRHRRPGCCWRRSSRGLARSSSRFPRTDPPRHAPRDARRRPRGAADGLLGGLLCQRRDRLPATDRAAYDQRRASGAALRNKLSASRGRRTRSCRPSRMFAIHECVGTEQNAVERFFGHRASRVVPTGDRGDLGESHQFASSETIVGRPPDRRHPRPLGRPGRMFHIMAVTPGRRSGRGSRATTCPACVGDRAVDDGARVMDLGWGSWRPRPPKSRLGPTGIPIAHLVGARRRADQALLLSLRGLARKCALLARKAGRARHEATRLLRRSTKVIPMGRLRARHSTKIPGSIRRRGVRATASTAWTYGARSTVPAAPLHLSEGILI